MSTAIDAWREQILAYDRYMTTLRGGGDGHGHGHGHGGGHGRGAGFSLVNRPLDPHRTDDPVVNSLYGLLGKNADVLDVGGGAGRYALPLATRARRVTVVEPSEDAVALLTERAAETGLRNITVISEPWEEAEAPMADVVLCSMVLHHVADAAPFIAKLQRHARDCVVLVEMMETPGAAEVPFYERVHGSAPTPLPGLPMVLGLLWAMEVYPDVTMLSGEAPVIAADRDSALDQLRRRLAVEDGTDADERLRAAADELLEETPAGMVVRGVAPRRPAIVSWQPGS